MSGIYERQDTSVSSLSEGEAKEFHKLFLTSFIAFTVVAIIAHFLVWQWRPWLPGPNGYTTSMLINGAHDSLTAFLPRLA